MIPICFTILVSEKIYYWKRKKSIHWNNQEQEHQLCYNSIKINFAIDFESAYYKSLQVNTVVWFSPNLLM